MNYQEDHVYSDVQEQMRKNAIEEMRLRLMQTDHDCRNGDPDDGCRTCAWVLDAHDWEIISKYREIYGTTDE